MTQFSEGPTPTFNKGGEGGCLLWADHQNTRHDIFAMEDVLPIASLTPLMNIFQHQHFLQQQLNFEQFIMLIFIF